MYETAQRQHKRDRGVSFSAFGSKKQELSTSCLRKTRLFRVRSAQPFEWNRSLIQGTQQGLGEGMSCETETSVREAASPERVLFPAEMAAVRSAGQGGEKLIVRYFLD
jgi:hypothetical protein